MDRTVDLIIIAVYLVLIALLGATLAFHSSGELLHSDSLTEFSFYLLGSLLGLIMFLFSLSEA